MSASLMGCHSLIAFENQYRLPICNANIGGYAHWKGSKYVLYMIWWQTHSTVPCEMLYRLVWVAILCHLPQYEYGSRVPKPGYEGGGIPGSVRILGQVTQFWQNILNLYYSTGSWKLRGAMWVAAESGNLWSWALHTTHYYYNYQYFCIQWH